MRKNTHCLLILASALSVGIPAGSAAGKVLYHWTQVGPAARLIARVVTDGTACPSITVHGRALSLEERAAPAADFDTRVCERTLPPDATQATLDDRIFPLLANTIQRIAVIGDTGCRLKGDQMQACHDPVDWPFATVAEAVARQRPDLIMHLGDYHYRESECPSNANCQGSPFGDNAPTWEADWFAPAHAMFSQAPLLLIRGNHEQCGWAPQGWLRYLAIGPMPIQCPRIEDVWRAQLPGLDVVVFDSSYGPADRSAPASLQPMRPMAAAAFAARGHEAWVLTHRPLWVRYDPRGSEGDVTQRQAFGALMPDVVTLVVSGHIHSFQLFDMETGPSQVVSGNGGVALYPAPDEVVHDITVGGGEAHMAASSSGFGFGLLERTPDGHWRLTAFDQQGAQRRSCILQARDITCTVVASSPPSQQRRRSSPRSSP